MIFLYMYVMHSAYSPDPLLPLFLFPNLFPTNVFPTFMTFCCFV